MIARRSGLDPTALAAAVLAVLRWGAVPVGTRFLVDGRTQHLDPVLFTALRVGLSALILLPALLRARPWSWPKADRRLALGTAALGVVGYNLPVAIGQVHVDAGATALVIATEPIWILLFWSLKTRRRPGPARIVSALAGLAGVALLALPLAQRMGIGAGILWVLGGAVCWSAYTVAVAPLVRRHGALSVTAVTVALGALPLLLLAAPALPEVRQIGPLEAGLILLLALGSTVLASVMWNLAVARLPGPVAGQCLYGIPAVGLLAGHLLLGEQIGGATGLALTVIAAGLWIGRREAAR